MITYKTFAKFVTHRGRRLTRASRALAALLVLAGSAALPEDAARAGTVQAEVVDAFSGESLSGIEVTLFDPATAAPVQTAVTEAPDSFSPVVATFNDVSPGEYIVRYEDPAGAYQPIWSGATSDPRLAWTILVNETDLTVPSTAALTKAHGRLFARVFDNAPGSPTFGEPLGGIRVTLFSNATGGAAAVAMTGDDPLAPEFGVAEFPAVAPGDYIARVEDPAGHFAPSWSGAAATANLAEIAVVTAGGIADFSDFGLRPLTATIIAHTSEDGTGDPLGGIEVTLHTADTGEPVAAMLTGSDPNGIDFSQARFEAVPAGTYIAHFRDPNGVYPSIWSGNVATANLASTVSVAGGDLNGFDAHLAPAASTPDGPGTIVGDVTDGNTGAPLAGVVVTIIDAANMVEAAQETTDAAGLFSRSISPGSYVLRFEDPDGVYLPIWYSNATEATLGAPVVVTAGGTTVTTQDLLPTPPPPPSPPPTTGTGQLHGEVDRSTTIVEDGFVTYTTEPAPNATVVLVDAETGDQAAATVTGPDGSFDIVLPAPRSYLALINDGVQTISHPWVVRVLEGHTTATSYYLGTDLPGPANGTARISADLKAPGIPVRFVDLESGATVASGVTGSSHVFTADVPSPGRYGIVGLDAPDDIYHCTWRQSDTTPAECSDSFYSIRVQPVETGGLYTVFTDLVFFAPPPEPDPEFTNIHGLVTATTLDTGTPLSGIQVDSFDAATGARFGTTTTTSSGTYSIGAQVGRRYVIRFIDPAGVYASEFFAEGSLVTSAVPVAATSTSTVTGINIALDPAASPLPGPATITGEVFDGQTWNPLSDIAVDVLDLATLEILSSQVTDELGAFVSEVIAPAEVVLRLHDPVGRYPTRFVVSEELAAAQIHQLSPGGSVSTLGTLTALAGTIYGTVHDDLTHDPIQGALAAAINLITGDVDGIGTSDATGSYNVRVAGPGSYLLLVSDPEDDYHPNLLPMGSGGLSGAFPLQVEAGGQLQVDTGLVPSRGPLFAEVRNDDSFDLLPGIELSVLDPWSLDPVSHFTTDAAGQILEFLPAPGSYLFRFQDPSGVYLPEFYHNSPRLDTAQQLSASPTSFFEVRAELASNTPPAAADDGYAVDEDQVLNVAAPGALGNDIDAEGDTLTATVVTGPVNGVLALGSDGSFTYTPNADFHGTDSFTYQASDGPGSATATVSLTVNPVNDAPIADADVHAVDEDQILAVSAPGVLANDSDVDGDSLVTTVVSGPANGVLDLVADGAFTYTPNADFHGIDGFTYRVSDGTASTEAVVTLTVNAVNDAPFAGGDAYALDEDQVLTVPAPGLLANDTDVDGDTLSAAVLSEPTNGVLVLNTDGSFSYTPAANYHGTDGFAYRVFDGAETADATVAITVVPVNDAPVALSDAFTLDEDQVLTVPAPGLLANDSDVDGDSLATAVVSGPANGVLGLAADGSFTYTPNSNFNGSDGFTYLAFDGTESHQASVALTVNAVNDAPTLADVLCYPSDPIPVGSDGGVQALLGDADIGDSHTITVAWGDGAAESLTAATGSLGATHTYTMPGVFEVTLTAEDAAAAKAEATCSEFIVVYDPDGGFVTGGGWFESPAGAYPTDPGLAGTAQIGFAAKYQRGATVPSGNTEFRFRAADFEFRSSTYEWLVISGSRAQFKGEGAIKDREGSFDFLLTAIDGDLNGKDAPDRVRIRIADPVTGETVYDNELGADDGSDPATPLTQGAIVIHAGKKQ